MNEFECSAGTNYFGTGSCAASEITEISEYRPEALSSVIDELSHRACYRQQFRANFRKMSVATSRKGS
jgi:hypothetical protein